MLLCSTLFLLPVVWSRHAFYLFNFPFQAQDWVVILEICLSSAGYLIFFKLLKIAGSVYYSFVGAIVALTGLFWGWLVFSEELSWLSGSAIVLIILAVVLVSRRERR